MSYSDWMTKTSEDITVLDEPESDQEFCERRKPPMYEDTQPVSPSMDVDRENCLCPDKEGDPHAHDIYQRPRNTKSMESSTSQISRSSMGEDYFGFMDQVVRGSVVLLNCVVSFGFNAICVGYCCLSWHHALMKAHTYQK